MTNHDEQMKAGARLVSGRPDWIDAPAVQAWHRSDRRTEYDGTPGKPRIWSPGYRTTEHWSTPSLQNVHWSDLVDVVPLAAPAGSYTRTDEADWKARAEKAEKERDEARRQLRETATLLEGEQATVKAAHSLILEQNRQIAAEPRPLTPRQNLAALWESAHRPVGGRIPAGTAIITRSDHGNGDVRYQTLEATGRDLPDEGRTLERNYPYGPENGEEYRLLDPPKRPEGVEEIEGLITYHYDDMPTETLTALSDAIAERYTPIEGGAR